MKSKRYKIFIHWVTPNPDDDLGTIIIIDECFLIETLKNIVSPAIDRIEVFEDNDL